MTVIHGDGYTLYQGDALDILPTLAAGSVDAVVTDPPYGLGFAYNSYEDTRDNLRRLIADCMPQVRRVAPRVYVLPGITQISLYPEPDWILSVVWNTTASFGKYGYTQWMPVLAYGKDLRGFGNVNGVTKTDTIKIGGGGGVGFMRGQEEKAHPCPKPITLMRMLVNRLTCSGDLVLDPFAGSGTTGVVCLQTGRRFIGIELDEQYFAIAAQRLEAAAAARQPALLAVGD